MTEKENKIKEMVEKNLGLKISAIYFNDAYEMALRKQKYIFDLCKEKVVLEEFYLATLTEEYLRMIALQIKLEIANERKITNE